MLCLGERISRHIEITEEAECGRRMTRMQNKGISADFGGALSHNQIMAYIIHHNKSTITTLMATSNSFIEWPVMHFIIFPFLWVSEARYRFCVAGFGAQLGEQPCAQVWPLDSCLRVDQVLY